MIAPRTAPAHKPVYPLRSLSPERQCETNVSRAVHCIQRLSGRRIRCRLSLSQKQNIPSGNPPRGMTTNRTSASARSTLSSRVQGSHAPRGPRGKWDTHETAFVGSREQLDPRVSSKVLATVVKHLCTSQDPSSTCEWVLNPCLET